MTNKVESDNNRRNLMTLYCNLEDFLTSDFNQTNFKLRSDQRVLEKYQEVSCNDTHWKTFETIDDFVIEQLSDCQSFFDVFVD